MAFNPYPDETKWRNELPNNSPLQFMSYGMMTEMIQPIIIELIKVKRDTRLREIIEYLTIDNIVILQNEIIREAKKVKVWKYKEWTKGAQNKKSKLL